MAQSRYRVSQAHGIYKVASGDSDWIHGRTEEMPSDTSLDIDASEGSCSCYLYSFR